MRPPPNRQPAADHGTSATRCVGAWRGARARHASSSVGCGRGRHCAPADGEVCCDRGKEEAAQHAVVELGGHVPGRAVRVDEAARRPVCQDLLAARSRPRPPTQTWVRGIARGGLLVYDTAAAAPAGAGHGQRTVGPAFGLCETVWRAGGNHLKNLVVQENMRQPPALTS